MGLALLFCVSSELLGAEALSVLHAEAPEFTTIAVKARLSGTVLVRVQIDPAGDVLSSAIEKKFPMGLDRSAAAAALRWRFNPSARGEAREAVLSFHFDHGTTSEPSHVEASLAGPLALSVVYQHSTVLWLPREEGELPEKLCPVHGIPMSVEQIELGKRPPDRPRFDETPEGQLREAEWETYKQALSQARQELFPESHWIAESACYYSGCLLICPMPGLEKAEVYYCQACRDAETAWRESHPDPTAEDSPPL